MLIELLVKMPLLFTISTYNLIYNKYHLTFKDKNKKWVVKMFFVFIQVKKFVFVFNPPQVN